MKKQVGITLIGLVITIIVTLILAGVTLNVLVGENGVIVRAQNAQMSTEEARRRENLEYIVFDYNTSQFYNEEEGLGKYLETLVSSGQIDSFAATTDGDYAIIEYQGKKYEVSRESENSKYYNVKEEVTENLGNIADNYILTQKTLDSTDNFAFEDKKSYIIVDENLKGDDFEFNIPDNAEVTIKVLYDMTIDNKDYPGRSAIELGDGATLNLYIYGKVTVTSSYAEEGEGATGWNAKGGVGANAGIHVGKGSTLNLYGTGTLIATGGDASAGNGTYGTGDSNTGGGGGGGAGAGIGGNGGNGGNANGEISNELNGSGFDGEAGEDCGSVNIYNSLTVYAYGGAGGASIPGTNENAGTGGGGYPAAGIGGGGAGGGGGDHAAGAGGYTGGSGQPYIARADNGMAANIMPDHGVGGAYFESGKITVAFLVDPETFANIGGQGALCHNWNTQGGDGGIAGKGGNIKVSQNASIYAYNGNKYTDGTAYNNGINQLEIYAQQGILRAIYKYDIFWNQKNYRYVNFFKELFGNTVVSTIDTYIAAPAERNVTHNNYLVRAQTTCATTAYVNPTSKNTQGVGSGAGYIELSNGTYTIDSSMN